MAPKIPYNPRTPSAIRPRNETARKLDRRMPPNSEVLTRLVNDGLCSKVIRTTSIGGGCINQAQKYETDNGTFFVKTNHDPSVNPPLMFAGEACSLAAIVAATNDSFAPSPLLHGPLSGGGGFLVTTFIPLTSGSGKHQRRLATLLAQMHSAPPVSPHETGKFGFSIPTMLGSTLQDNTWEDDWVEFWRERRLKPMIQNVLREHPNDRDVAELGAIVAEGLGKLFEGIVVKPALIHGDLYSFPGSGNWGANKETDEPVIFDPACYYVGGA
ncbi:hypothetical protein HK104_010914 [Borealophlyctis nickersoniae]|nr:hypothetical protein HK104_010914 [Borealophlyctis nickersoniae]